MRGAVIVAGGSSARFGEDKLDFDVAGESVLQRAVDCFIPFVSHIVVVGRRVEGALYAEGGDTRCQSVRNGIAALPDQVTVVAVHDAARPFASPQLIEKVFCEAERLGSAVPFVPVTDTLWQKPCTPCQREDFFCVQTPQAFDVKLLKEALAAQTGDFPDESTLFAKVHGKVNFVEGERGNVKITYPQDALRFKVGNGFDVHPFTEGEGFVLGGIKVPYTKTLKGHSDADVLTHAVCDALLTASGNRDIGCIFPDSDEKYRGISSLLLLSESARLAQKNGYFVKNVSAVVICQQPKLAEYLPLMSQKLADVLKIPAHCVNLSATTTEKLGALGNGDGIACQAYALVCGRQA